MTRRSAMALTYARQRISPLVDQPLSPMPQACPLQGAVDGLPTAGIVTRMGVRRCGAEKKGVFV